MSFDAVDQQHSSCKHLFSIGVKNSVVADQMALSFSEASCSESTVIQKKNKSEFSRVNALYIYANVYIFYVYYWFKYVLFYYICTITTHKLMISYKCDSKAS